MMLYSEKVASADKGTHGFPMPEQQLAALSSLMGVSLSRTITPRKAGRCVLRACVSLSTDAIEFKEYWCSP